MEHEIYHYGVKGMKWGERKNNYHSTGIRAALARKSNEKVDKNFKRWKENAIKKANAIDLGKKAIESRLAYESNKSDKSLKAQYKQDNKAYKKALKNNTTYRKGQIKNEVGAVLSRKYLSEAKKVKKQMVNDPSNKSLQKKYNDLMSKHDIERAHARRAPKVSAARSELKSSIKRSMTMTVKVIAGTAAVTAGVIAVNSYLRKHDVSLNGRPVYVSSNTIRNAASFGKSILGLSQYI